jgi:hypothetical protein
MYKNKIGAKTPILCSNPKYTYVKSIFDDCPIDKQSSMLSQFYKNWTTDFCKQNTPYFSCDSKRCKTQFNFDLKDASEINFDFSFNEN